MTAFSKLSFRNFTPSFFCIALMVLATSFCTFPAYAAGEVDVAFGTDGLVSTDFGGARDFGGAVIVDSSGRIIVVGQASSTADTFNSSFGLARYDQEGNLDPSFGSGGLVSTDFGGQDALGDGSDFARSVAIDSAGQILVAGTCTNSDADFGLARYDENGNLDTSFGNNGLISADFGSGQDYGWSVAVDSDDRIIVGGYCKSESGDYDIALVRFDEYGCLDPSFGNGGIISTDFGKTDNRCRSLVLDSEERILAVGSTYNSDNDFALVRYDKNGNLDTSFGNGGIVSLDFNGSDEAWSVTIDEADRILIAGGSSNASGYSVDLARYDENGDLDPSFGTGGVVSNDLGGSVASSTSRAVVDSNGRIVISTTVFNGGTNDFALARFDQTGNLDNAFGSNSIVSTDFGGQHDYGRSCVIDGSGRILVTGYTQNSIGEMDLALVRYGESFTIIPYWTSGGVITPVSTLVFQGNSLNFTISPDISYHIEEIYVDGESISFEPVDNKYIYTFDNVSADHWLFTVFEPGSDDDVDDSTSDDDVADDDTEGSGSSGGGCNISVLQDMGLLLMLPLILLSGKMK